MTEVQEPSQVTTESSKAVLKTVAGRLSNIEAGDLPVIERVGTDGAAGYAVDHTGEMLRPSVEQVSDSREAAESFAAEHLITASAPPAPKPPTGRPAPPSTSSEPSSAGIWARIKGWFKKS